MFLHKSVMPTQILKYLAVTADNVYIDCTTGEGGHSELLLQNNHVKQLVCIEQDQEFIQNCTGKIESLYKCDLCK